MEMHQIKQFVAVANHGSMREAAKRLNLSTSALSQGIKKLERSLGCELLDRTRTPIALTEYGSLLLPHAESILFHSQVATREIAEKLNEEKTKIKVGCFYDIILNSAIVSMAAANPHSFFEATIAQAPVLKKMLLQEKLDIAFLPDLGSLPGFRKVLLGEESLFLSIPASFEASNLDSCSLANLHGTKITIPQDMMGISEWYKKLLDSAGFTNDEIIELPVEQYFVQMNQTKMVHFRSSLMSESTISAMDRKHVRLSDALATREITAYYPKKNDSKLEDAIDSLKAKERLGAMQSLSHLLHASKLDNLSVQQG